MSLRSFQTLLHNVLSLSMMLLLYNWKPYTFNFGYTMEGKFYHVCSVVEESASLVFSATIA